jgi:hypothetical protein
MVKRHTTCDYCGREFFSETMKCPYCRYVTRSAAMAHGSGKRERGIRKHIEKQKADAIERHRANKV